jgi:hypothetical protein
MQSELWTTTKKLKTFLGKAKDFDAILYVGGFGRRILIQILFIEDPADDRFAASNSVLKKYSHYLSYLIFNS